MTITYSQGTSLPILNMYIVLLLFSMFIYVTRDTSKSEQCKANLKNSNLKKYFELDKSWLLGRPEVL